MEKSCMKSVGKKIPATHMVSDVSEIDAAWLADAIVSVYAVPHRPEVLMEEVARYVSDSLGEAE